MMEKYSVKAVRTFHGHDGFAWECNLYNDQSKKIAVVVEDGWGGELKFHWKDADLPRIETDGVDWKDAPMKYKDTPAESALRTHCLSLPKWNCNGKMHHTGMDIYASNLVNEALMLKDIKKMLKKLTVLDDGKIYTYNAVPAHEKTRRSIEKTRPHAIFLNDLPISEVVAIWKAAV